MKRKNWLSLVALTLLISLSMSSCYYGVYGPPRPRYHQPHYHHHHHGGYGGGGYYR